MCGIFGRFNLNKKPVAHDELEEMSQSLKHRGPNDTHYFLKQNFGFGTNRLSIIDLAHGRQPLANEDATIWAIQNGEIYNYRELREKLVRRGHTFKTESDTEIIVHLYEEKGEVLARELRGMFAAAVFDTKKRRLMIFRDRIGIKPVYYSFRHDQFIFGSELKALLTQNIERILNQTAIHDYLSLNFIPGSQTIFDGIQKLEPGHVLTVDARGLIKKPYWQLSTFFNTPFEGVDENDVENELKKILKDAVRYHLISDVPLGVFLSGGLDSSVIVAYASQLHNKKIKTFSVGFKEQSFDERNFARTIAKRFDTDHQELVIDMDVDELVFQMASYWDEPFGDSSAIPTFAISQAARAKVKVILTGDGGDEVFGGYEIYKADELFKYYHRIPYTIRQSILCRLVDLLPVSHEKMSLDFKIRRFFRGSLSDRLEAHYLWRVIFTEEEKKLLYRVYPRIRPTYTLYQDAYEEVSSADRFNKFLYVDTKINLVDDMLTKVDRMSMANSIEVRVPLLDHLLVEFAARVPGRLKIRGLTLKYLLKKAMAGLLPDSIINRPKAGFHSPVPLWIRHELRAAINDYLSPSFLKKSGDIFNSLLVQKMIEEHYRGKKDWSRNIWGIFMFQLWYERFWK